MFRDVSLMHVYNLLSDIHSEQIDFRDSNLCRNYVDISTFWDYTEFVHLFIANITHFLDNKQSHLLIRGYSICLHRRAAIYKHSNDKIGNNSVSGRIMQIL